MRTVDRVFGLETPFESGHSQSRAKTTRKIKLIDVSWHLIPTDEYLDLVAFFRDVGNFDAFYWQWPLGMYGEPGFGGISQTDDDGTGFGQTEQEVGYGEGLVFLMRFVEPELQAEYSTEFDRWNVATRMKQV
jgi:hypothetical protein